MLKFDPPTTIEVKQSVENWYSWELLLQRHSVMMSPMWYLKRAANVQSTKPPKKVFT